MSKEVVVLSAVRSPIGAFGGSLADMDPCDLGGMVMKEAIARSGVDPQQIKQRGIDVDRSHYRIARAAGHDVIGPGPEQRHARATFVQRSLAVT